MTIQLVSTPNGFEERDSGLIQLGGAQSAPVSIAPTSRVIDGPVTYTAGSGEAVQRGATRHQVSHEGTPGGSVMATRQRTNGVDTVELVPGVPGSRTNIKTAIRDGLIKETSPGFYEDAAGQQATSQEAPQEPQEEPQQDPGAPVFDAREDAAWSQYIDPLPQHAYDAAVAAGVGFAVHGMGSLDDVAKSLARGAGLEVAQAEDFAYAGAGLYQRAADRALAAVGLDGDTLQEFYAHAKTQPRPLQDAVQRLIHQRDPGGFQEMARAWKGTNSAKLPEVKAMQAAGFETFVDRQTGEVMARKGQGQWVSARKILGA